MTTKIFKLNGQECSEEDMPEEANAIKPYIRAAMTLFEDILENDDLTMMQRFSATQSISLSLMASTIAMQLGTLKNIIESEGDSPSSQALKKMIANFAGVLAASIEAALETLKDDF